EAPGAGVVVDVPAPGRRRRERAGRERVVRELAREHEARRLRGRPLAERMFGLGADPERASPLGGAGRLERRAGLVAGADGVALAEPRLGLVGRIDETGLHGADPVRQAPRAAYGHASRGGAADVAREVDGSLS